MNELTLPPPLSSSTTDLDYTFDLRPDQSFASSSNERRGPDAVYGVCLNDNPNQESCDHDNDDMEADDLCEDLNEEDGSSEEEEECRLL